jgi:hypothetical protein
VAAEVETVAAEEAAAEAAAAAGPRVAVEAAAAVGPLVEAAAEVEEEAAVEAAAAEVEEEAAVEAAAGPLVEAAAVRPTTDWASGWTRRCLRRGRGRRLRRPARAGQVRRLVELADGARDGAA